MDREGMSKGGVDMYTLGEGIYFVPGAKQGALCDTNTGNVYSINETATKILRGEIQNEEFWQKLVVMSLAQVSERETTIPALPTLDDATLTFMWFEVISDDCNERCLHCYADSMPPTYRRKMQLASVQTSGSEPSKRKLTYQDWCQIICEGYTLGCRQGQFIGGEPFLYRGEQGETVLDLAGYARQVGFDLIEIFTNATLLTPAKIAHIKALGLHIAVSLYSHDPHVHDAITRMPGSHKKTMTALQLLREAEIPTRVESVIMRTNQATVATTIQLIDELGFGHKTPDPLRPKGRGDNPALMPEDEILVQYGLMTGPDFTASQETLAHYRSGHSCLLGKITITDSGDVLPCIFSRSQVIGNVRASGSLAQIVASQAVQRIWQTTKDSVLVCRDCEYRYVCFDCRPLSEASASGNGEYLSAPYPRCTYNPYTGEWGGGVWKVDEHGQPYYDERLKPVIEKALANGVPT